MSTNKQALRKKAEKAGGEEWQVRKESFDGEYAVIVKGSLVKHRGWSTHRPVAGEVVDKKTADFIAAANPATVLALLDELEAAERRNAELSASHGKLHEGMAAIYNAICENGASTSLSAILTFVKCAFEESKAAAGISVKGE